MSTWGGMGEGLAAGMNNRIALWEREQERKRQQANADRAFQFQQEQADRAQANADRQFGESVRRADQAQANADRAFDEGVRRADMAQANADRAFQFGVEKAQADFDNANREFALKESEQDWSNRISAQREQQFMLQNQKLQDELNRQMEEQKIVQSNGQRQLAHAIYAARTWGNFYDTGSLNIGGQNFNAMVMPKQTRDSIFGSEGPLSDVENVYVVDTDNGKRIAVERNIGGRIATDLLSEQQEYDTLRTVSDSFADRAMSDFKNKKDIGLVASMEQAKAEAKERVLNANDPYGHKRIIDACVAIIKSDDASEDQRQSAIDKLSEIANFVDSKSANRGVAGGISTPEEAQRARAALERKRAEEKKKKVFVKPKNAGMKSKDEN